MWTFDGGFRVVSLFRLYVAFCLWLVGFVFVYCANNELSCKSYVRFDVLIRSVS